MLMQPTCCLRLTLLRFVLTVEQDPDQMLVLIMFMEYRNRLAQVRSLVSAVEAQDAIGRAGK